MKKYLLPAFLALTFFIIGLVTLPDYGINWDAPFRMIRGQIYLDQMLGRESPKKNISPMIIKPNEFATRFNFLDGEEGSMVKLPDRPLFESLHQQSFYRDGNFKNYFMDRLEGHPPLIDILAALSNRILTNYQIVYLLFSSIGIFVVALFSFEITHSYLASLISGLILALWPLYFSEAHFNMKDPIQASFFAGSIWAFWHWAKSGKLRWFGVFGGFAGLALATKWNIVFLLFILIPWLFLIKFRDWGRLARLGVLGGLGILIFLILIWPPLWKDPLAVVNVFKYYGELGTRLNPIQPEGFILPGGFNSYPTILLFSQTPEIVLALLAIGVIRVIKERGGELKTGFLLLLWLLVPVIRISLPHIWFYNGLRQIMEVFPAIAIMAGIGAGYLVQKVQSTKLKVKSFGIFFCLFTFAFLLLSIIRLHPNQNVYFNALIGGVKGADEKNLIDWTLTYGNIYKQAADWLNKTAEQGSDIALLDGSMFALSPLMLRQDLSISPYHFSGIDKKGEYIISLYNPYQPAHFAYHYPNRFLKPIHTISVDGVPLLNIYKNDPQYLREGFDKEKSTTEFEVSNSRSNEGSYLEVNLGKMVKVTRLIVINIPRYCLSSYSQFIDEFIQFDSSTGSPPVRYGLQERTRQGNRVEFFFPAEPTRLIKIYPISNQSCFTTGQIIQVKYL